MHDLRIPFGFYAAAAFNIAGMALFSKGLTNTVLFDTDPAMFSRPACLLVMMAAREHETSAPPPFRCPTTTTTKQINE